MPTRKTKLTVANVKRRVEVIKRAAVHDAEIAHTAEDGLWDAVLTAIAAGVSNPAELARAALETKAIKFGRWTS